MKKIPLIHPIYLDVPMLVSFAAAVQDGLTFETEVTSEKNASKAASAGLSGKFGFGKFIQSLVDVSASTEVAGNFSSEVREFRKEAKSYTEASIAIILYHQLQQDGGYILNPKNADDLNAVDHGTLIEISGKIEKNAVDTVIDYINALNILSSMATAEQPLRPKAKGMNRNENPNSHVSRIGEALNKDRERTPISNVVVRCSEPKDLNVVVTLRTENLRDLTLSELHKNNVHIVGKITRKISENETMGSFENYGMALLKPEMLNNLFQSIADNEEIVAEFTEVEVRGPAYQILPLMIFV